MIGKKDYDLRLGHGLFKAHQADPALKALRQGVDVGLNHQDVSVQGAGKETDDVHRRALAQIVCVGLVGEAEAGDGGPVHPLGSVNDEVSYVGGLGVVDPAGGADEVGFAGG